MQFDRQAFFDAVRGPLFGGKLTSAQVAGIGAIADAFEKRGTGDLRHLAYILATPHHETGKRFECVREGQGQRASWTDAQARNAVAKLKKDGRISVNYALPEANGLSYYGRGLPQLTWGKNYKSMGTLIGVDLYANPDRMLELEISALVVVEGMLKAVSIRGDFTGRALEEFIHGTTCDYVQARRTVNGLDKADLIAGYAEKYEAALRPAWYGASKPAPAAPSEPAAPIALPRTRLAFGAKGADVEKLQGALNACGANPPLTIDGAFLTKTRDAVAAFEVAQGLAGVVDDAVWTALETASKPSGDVA